MFPAVEHHKEASGLYQYIGDVKSEWLIIEGQ